MKHILLLLISLWCLFNIQSFVYATSLFDYNVDLPKDDFQGTVVMKIGQERFFIDGNEASGDKPFLYDNRTMVPLRTISEAFGAKVNWSAPDNKVTVTLNNQKIELILGSKDMSVNGNKKELDVAAQAYSGRTYLPLRAIGEALGKSVGYVGDYNLILIAESSEWIERYAHSISHISFSWAIEGKKILYGDDRIIVYYNNDALYLHNLYSNKDYPFTKNGLPEGHGYRWYSTSVGECIAYYGDSLAGDQVYQFKEGKIKQIYSGKIGDIKFVNEHMYIIVRGLGPDPGNFPDVSEHSNLLKVNLQDYTQEYLGLKDYVYGYISSGNSDMGEQDNDWQIKDDGIYIYGFCHLLDNDTTWEERMAEEKNTKGHYKVSLTGQDQVKLTQ